MPLLSGVNRGTPWAEDPAEGAGNLLESALGAYTSGLLAEWPLPAGFGADGAAGRVAAEPDVWTDGSLVKDKVSGASSSGSGFFTGNAVIFGLIGGGAILMMMLVGTGSSGLAVAIVLFLVRYKLSRGLSSGVSFLLSRLLMAFTLVLIIWVLYVMSVAYWTAMLALVLLSLSRMVILFCFLVGASS